MPPRKDPAVSASSSTGSAVAAANGPAMAPMTRETLEELENKRDAFVEAMNTLSYAAKTAARTGYDYFNILASASGPTPLSSLLPPDVTPHVHANGFIPINYNAHVRATSVAPGDTRGRPAAMLPTAVEEDGEEPADDGGKKKRKRGPAKKDKKDMDPDAPKKPISAYFQFTAAARPIIKQDMGEGISAKEVISEAASRWGALPVEQKQMWLAQHHQQMVKWYIDTNAYRATKGLPLEPVPKDYQPGANPTNLPPVAPGGEEEEEEEHTTTPDEAEEDEDEEEEESPATPPPPPAKKVRVTPKQNGAAAAAPGNTTTAPAPKKRGRPPKDRSANSAAATTTITTPAPATPTTTAAAADQPATPDPAKRTRAPSIKAKEAKELALAKAPTTRSPSKNTNTNTPTATTAVITAAATAATADAAEKQVQDEAEGSITVMGGGGAGLKMKSMETVGSMKEKRERKKRRGKGEE